MVNPADVEITGPFPLSSPRTSALFLWLTPAPQTSISGSQTALSVSSQGQSVTSSRSTQPSLQTPSIWYRHHPLFVVWPWPAGSCFSVVSPIHCQATQGQVIFRTVVMERARLNCDSLDSARPSLKVRWCRPVFHWSWKEAQHSSTTQPFPGWLRRHSLQGLFQAEERWARPPSTISSTTPTESPCNQPHHCGLPQEGSAWWCCSYLVKGTIAGRNDLTSADLCVNLDKLFGTFAKNSKKPASQVNESSNHTVSSQGAKV